MKKIILFVSSLVIFCLVAMQYTHAHDEAQRTKYLSDLRVVEFASLAMAQYASVHHNRLPNAAHWEESIKPYWQEKDFKVSLEEHPGNRLAMNSKLSDVKLEQIGSPDQTVLLYETHSVRKDAAGLPPWKQYHQCDSSTKNRLMIAFVSGWCSSFAEGPEIITRFPTKK